MEIQRRTLLATVVGGLTATSGCLGTRAADDAGSVAPISDETLTLTTTTSTYDTGLLDELNTAFTDRFGVVVNAVAQGTGAALETARNGDSDVVMVHARSLEDAFISEGSGINRRDLMFNDFVLVGPEDDTAGITDLTAVTDAVERLADQQVTVVSRGDNSGTHVKERAIWAAAGVDPGGDWYREAGAGMGDVLVQTDQSGGYTLTDRGTYLSMRSELSLRICLQGPIEGGPDLLANPYGIIAVNPAVHPHVNYDLAMAYIGFVTSPEGQQHIADFRVDGEPLFVPNAISQEPNNGQYVPEDWTPAE